MFCPSLTVRNKEPRLFRTNQLGRPLPQKNHSSLQPKRGERGNTSANVSILCPFSLNLIKHVYFPREVQLTPSTLIQSSPEKWFQVLWVGLQSSAPAPAPATPLTGSPSWPLRTASCEAGTLWRELFLHCRRLSLYDLYWTLQGLSPLKMRHYKDDFITSHVVFFVLVSTFVDSVQERLWTGWTGHADTYEASGIMVISCVSAGRSQLQLRLIP